MREQCLLMTRPSENELVEKKTHAQRERQRDRENCGGGVEKASHLRAEATLRVSYYQGRT